MRWKCLIRSLWRERRRRRYAENELLSIRFELGDLRGRLDQSALQTLCANRRNEYLEKKVRYLDLQLAKRQIPDSLPNDF